MSSCISQTVLFAADVTPLNDDRLYAAACRTVSPCRRIKAESLSFAKDRCLSLGAELLLRYGLREAGAEPADFEFSYGTQGKPRLKNCSLHFSISHSGTYAVCALSPFELGCDVEKIAPADLRLAKRFFCAEEYESIAAQPSPETQSDLFFRYWTLKESFLKVTGLGMKLPLNSFRIMLGQDISVIQSVDSRRYSFAEFSQIEGYKCALCASFGEMDAAFHFIDLREILQAEEY